MDPILNYTPDEIEQQRLRANQLRGQGVVGALGSTSQIPGAAAQGQLMQRLASQQVGDYQTQNQNELKRRGTEQDRGLARAAQRDQLAFQKEQQTALEQNREEVNRLKQLEIGAKTAEEQRDAALAAEKAQEKYEGEVAKQTTKYTDTLVKENIPRLEENMSRLRKLLEPYKNEDGTYSNIPGVGGAMNIPLVGNVAARTSDMLTAGEGDAREIQQAWQELKNTKIKDDSGATVTVQENKRLGSALGSGWMDDDKAMLDGIDALESVINEKRATIDAGASDDVIAEYQRRSGRGKEAEDAAKKRLEELRALAQAGG